MVENSCKRSKRVENGSKWSKMVTNGSKWSKMVKNGSNWSNLAAGDEAAVLEAGDGRHDQAQQAALLLLS